MVFKHWEINQNIMKSSIKKVSEVIFFNKGDCTGLYGAENNLIEKNKEIIIKK